MCARARTAPHTPFHNPNPANQRHNRSAGSRCRKVQGEREQLASPLVALDKYGDRFGGTETRSGRKRVWPEDHLPCSRRHLPSLKTSSAT
ncbi:hypothetical protein CN193_19310 [Sinorhizobium meliloti]|nr:hypothetical protein CN193_19310 [Sinorhizobium meliloti]